MTDLRDAMQHKTISEPVQQVVLAAAGRHPCQPLERSRDGSSVPCVAEQGTQVALYPMKHRIAIAMSPDRAEFWGTQLGAKLEKKTRRTTYLHLVKQQLINPAVAARAVDAAVEALQLCRDRPQGAHGEEERPTLRDFGGCTTHGYRLNALGGCPQCDDE